MIFSTLCFWLLNPGELMPPVLWRCANIIKEELATDMVEITGDSLTNNQSLNKLILSLEDDQILFIDEIHLLHRSLLGTMLTALSQQKVCIRRDSSGKKPITIETPRFWCIGATTDPWTLPNPLRQRFTVLNFEYYSESELVKLLTQRSRAMGLEVEGGVLEALAKRGKETPRICISHLRACHRTARSENDSVVRLEHVHKTMQMLQIDDLGLDATERGYMRELSKAGNTVRLNVVASKLGLPTRTVSQIVEPYLLRRDLIEKHANGRMLTRKGIQHLDGSYEEQDR